MYEKKKEIDIRAITVSSCIGNAVFQLFVNVLFQEILKELQ
jgi:hypothetical protein